MKSGKLYDPANAVDGLVRDLYVENGRIVAAAQEERFTRHKHDAGFPAKAITYCLEEGNTNLASIDLVVFYDKPFLKFERLLETYVAYAPRGFQSFLKAMPVWLRAYTPPPRRRSAAPG